MKMKVSFDKEAIRTFFIDHTEKIVFAGVVTCFGLIVYSAFAREKFEKEPQDLQSAAESARAHWEKSVLPPEEVEHRPYPEIAKTNSAPVSVASYKWKQPLNQPPVPKKPLRGIPPVLNIRELRASSGRAPFNVNQAGQQRGTDRQGFRYVVLTGLVPIAEQFYAYEEYYKPRMAYDMERDEPTYYWYSVERAEIEPGQAPEEAEWVPFDPRRSLAVQQRFGQNRAGEVVDERYVHERYTFPLPPRADGAEWGEEVAHPDEIPLPEPEKVAGEEGAYPGEQPEEVTEVPEVPEMPVMPPMPGEERRTARIERETELEEEETVNLLFRFFDFSVKPGKRYRYRVKISLVNTSYGMEQRFLEVMPEGEPPLGVRKTIEARNWTEPTNVVEIPVDHEMMLLAVKAPYRAGDDPKAELGVVQWVNSEGRMTYQDFEDLKRGSLMNFTGYQFPGGKIEQEEPVRRPRREPRNVRGGEGGEFGEFIGPEDFGAEGAMGEGASGFVRGDEAVEGMPVDYLTGAIVLDLRGGERLADRGAERRPGEALLIDGEGNLVIRRELEGVPEFEKRKQEIDWAMDPTAREMMEPGMMEPGMMPEGGEGGLIWEGS